MKYLNKNKGFTLIETMMAILVLSIALVSLLTLISGNLFYSKYIKNEITANYLMQEVIDYIRNDRDTTILYGENEDDSSNWDTFLNKYIDAGCFTDGCILDAKNETIDSCDDSNCDYLKYDSDIQNGNFYNYKYGEDTSFERIIKMEEGESSDEIVFTVTVKWKNGNLSKERSLKSNLTNWYE